MKIIESNGMFTIYGGNSVKTYDKLKPGYYEVFFHKQKGFWLEEHPEMELKEDRVYGNHTEKVNKVLNSFDMFNRNLGVMLSGDKGMGKSLFARMLSREAVKRGLPVIVVNFYVPGIMEEINKIQQEALVLFDEFDKTFEAREDYNPQYEVLNILDGLSIGKKLFTFICNNLDDINDCMINRPGRIHYHFRFSYPTEQEVRDYLRDKLKPEYYDQIDEVVKFTCMTKINYDCLRSIVFELNNGYKFKESINDLNILSISDSKSYCYVELKYKNDKTFVGCFTINLFDSNDSTGAWAVDKSASPLGEIKIRFNNNDIDMVKNKEYFATLSDFKLNGLELYHLSDDESRDELEKYYLNPDNVVTAILRKADDKRTNGRFF